MAAGDPAAGLDAARSGIDRVAGVVRAESSGGRPTRMESAWDGSVEDLQSALAESGDAGDITVLQEGGKVFLFSDRWMTVAYASIAVRAEAGSSTSSIADTVRHDSRLYPRPTPVVTFLAPPFNLSPDQLDAALDAISADASLGDIKRICASDGSVFLYSSAEMDAGQAASRAEWMAVGRYENP
ncbi:MAG: hypothetical protein EHM13_09715 [Acidobacteria bacterium]|nr:MAG: hypothetical protein EHM13_09715 [Acidobacteriota bacterium]